MPAIRAHGALLQIPPAARPVPHSANSPRKPFSPADCSRLGSLDKLQSNPRPKER